MPDLCDLSAAEALSRLRSREISPVDLVESCLARIAAVNPAVNAVVALDAEGARAAAREAEAAIRRGDRLGPLHGLPVAIKDLDETAGLRTTFGSLLYENHVPREDGGIAASVRAAGGIILGKTNTPEWGLGANTRNAVYGATGNPFDPQKSCAGSSGGAAVALATGMVPLATGSDMAGSLRTPAAFCGVVGFRPTAGLVPAEKRVLGWSPLSVLGPMARTVGDTALLLSVLARKDPRDPLSVAPPPLFPLPAVDLAKVRAAATEDFGLAPVERIIREAFRARADACRGWFASVEAAHPDCTGADESFATLRAAQVVAAHAERVRERPDRCGPNLHANVAEGLALSLADQAQAHAVQTRIFRAFERFFRDRDVLLAPAAAITPRSWRELYPAEIDGAPTRNYFHWLAVAYCVTLVGYPAVSLPVGRDAAGMPFGLQIVGRPGSDAQLLGIAAALERQFAADEHTRRPEPDLENLRRAPPIARAEGFLGWS
ncbi:MAG TPA: amidase family protein [Beijerinckiaceae bacterium]|jgi:Asp-tRNA(Asn)/Glu-tRNA(Gln) amidotransferase A subunit family amidase